MYQNPKKRHNKFESDTMIYIFIFFSKIIENSLATLRLIVVSNGKKNLGAILQLGISLVWIFSTGLVVVDIKNPIKIICFCLGCFIGSYVGSYLDEKLAMGNNMIICIIDAKKRKIIDDIRKHHYQVTVIDGTDKNIEKLILFILIKRKNFIKITNYIKKLDNDAIIISESAKGINGNFIR